MNNNGGCLALFWLILLFFVGGFVSFFVIVRQNTSIVTTDGLRRTAITPNTYEVVFVPAEAGVSWETLQEANRIMTRRLSALSLADQIEGSWTLDTSRTPQEMVLRFNENQMLADDVVETLRARGLLEFVDFSDVAAEDLPSLEGTRIATTYRADEAADGATLYPTVLTSEAIVNARAYRDETFGEYVIEVNLNEEGAATLGAFTQAHLGAGLAIVVDGVVLSIPTIQTQVTTPVLITGLFSEDEARTLAAQLNAAPMPIALDIARLTIIQP